MPRSIPAALAVLLSLLSCATSAAQPEGEALPSPAPGPRSIRFEHISLREGLSQSSVYEIMQDSQGFIWLGTQDGLNRFDGREFKVFKHVPFDSTSFADNWIWSIDEGPDGSIWAGTRAGGLNRLDPVTGEVTQYTHDPEDSTSLADEFVFDVLVDREGFVWAAMEEGLDRLDPNTGQIVHYRHDPDDSTSLNSPFVASLHEDDDGILWVGTANGVGRLDPKTGTFTRHFYTKKQRRQYDRIPDHLVGDIVETPATPGVLWLASGSGLVKLKKSTGEYVTYPIPGEVEDLIKVEVDPNVPEVLWATSDGAGLVRFDMRTEEYIVLRNDPNDPGSVGHDALFGLHADRSGMMWVGSQSHAGVDKFDPSASGFTNYVHRPGDPNSIHPGSIWGVYVPPSHPHEIWSVHQQGPQRQIDHLSRIDQRTGEVDRFGYDASDPRSLGGGVILTMHEDRAGTLWIATVGAGLNRFNRQQGDFTRFQHRPSDPSSLSSNDVRAIYEDSKGRLWIGTYGGGLNRMEPGRPGRFVRYRSDPDDPRSLLGKAIAPNGIAETPDGAIWIGTDKGLNRLDPDAGVFTRFPADGEEGSVAGAVQQVYVDLTGAVWIHALAGGASVLQRYDPDSGRFSRYEHDPADPNSLADEQVVALHELPTQPGVLWIGYPSAGFSRLDPETGEFRHYTELDGLPNNFVYGIVHDGEGNLWLSTNNGLARFEPVSETFRNFDEDDGLQTREFNQFAFHQAHSGQLVFGSVAGVTAFFPSRLEVNTIPPEVVLTDFRLFNESVKPGEESVLNVPISKAGEVHLAHWQRAITLEFVALHFKNPAGNRYAYMLEGFDDDWIPAGSRRSATYTNLDPGEYTFRVKAANSDGIWNETGATLALVIAPPFWDTTWFRLLGILTVVGLGFAFYRLRVRSIQDRNRQLEEEVQVRTAELRSTLDHLTATQAQLVQTEKMASLGQLTAGIAHEIKNPLNFINNFAALCDELSADLMSELEQNRARPVGTVAADLEEILTDLRTNAVKIREHGRRADGIVRSMLQHSKGKSGRLERTDINALMNEYVNLAYHGMRAQKSDFNVAIDRRLDSDAGTIEVFPQELGRVLINLLNNAFYAVHERSMSENGEFVPRVIVESRRKESELELRVRDNGPGISDAVRAKIFEPFFTTKPTGEGTGLGLSLSYDIVTKMHGGRIDVADNVDEGAEFIVTLPTGN